MQHIFDVQPADNELQQLESIRKVANEIRIQLRGFLDDVKPFEPYFGDNHSTGRVALKTFAKRVMWAQKYSQRTQKLRSNMLGQLLGLIVLLATQIL